MKLLPAAVLLISFVPGLAAQDTDASSSAPRAAQARTTAPARLDETLYDHFGAGILDGAPFVSVDAALRDPSAHTGRPVRLRGAIDSVCQVKGCWMYLGPSEQPVMVKFKDYAFFVPKDVAGRPTIVHGVLEMKEETLAQTRHYLEDAGRHDEAARLTEGRRIYTLVADGVAIRKDAPLLDAARHTTLGEPLRAGTWRDVGDVLAAPEAHAGQVLRVRGAVVEVCPTKGCWLRLGDGDRSLRIEFEDGTSIVPADADAPGRMAVVEGLLEARHEADASTTYVLRAHGVALEKPDA